MSRSPGIGGRGDCGPRAAVGSPGARLGSPRCLGSSRALDRLHRWRRSGWPAPGGADLAQPGDLRPSNHGDDACHGIFAGPVSWIHADAQRGAASACERLGDTPGGVAAPLWRRAGRLRGASGRLTGLSPGLAADRRRGPAVPRFPTASGTRARAGLGSEVHRPAVRSK
jgi:hypothetical protein